MNKRSVGVAARFFANVGLVTITSLAFIWVFTTLGVAFITVIIVTFYATLTARRISAGMRFVTIASPAFIWIPTAFKIAVVAVCVATLCIADTAS